MRVSTKLTMFESRPRFRELERATDEFKDKYDDAIIGRAAFFLFRYRIAQGPSW